MIGLKLTNKEAEILLIELTNTIEQTAEEIIRLQVIHKNLDSIKEKLITTEHINYEL